MMREENDHGTVAAVGARATALAERLAGVADEADEMSTLHPAMLPALRESGLAGLMVPAAYGGEAERVDPLLVARLREVLMPACVQADLVLSMQGIGSFALARGGSDELRRRWLPGVASLDHLAALALTEPVAGSDLKSLTSRLEPSGDDLVLNGAKSFISMAGAADFYSTLAREGEGYSLVLVPADSPGVTVSPLPTLAAPHVIGEVAFEDVVVPQAQRIGEAGSGFSLVLATLGTFRVSVAAGAVGLAEAALHEAVRHAREREQFGRPLAQLGPVASMLADSWTEVEMARLLTYDVAERARVDPLAELDRSSMAKLAATETAFRVIDRCVQVMGRWGLVRGARIEKLQRAARPLRIYEGASEVLRLGIARRLTKEVP